MITHDDALPFWAALMDSARSCRNGAEGSTPERLDAAKKQEVLDYLHQASDNIRVHLKPFHEGEVETRVGFCCAFPHEHDDSENQTERPNLYQGWQDTKKALRENKILHLYMNIDVLVDFDMWTYDWMYRTAADLREAMLNFATELCHQFAHAMADISQNGGEGPQFNNEAVIEPGFSFEQFVFGGRLNPDGYGGFWIRPSSSARMGPESMISVPLAELHCLLRRPVCLTAKCGSNCSTSASGTRPTLSRSSGFATPRRIGITAIATRAKSCPEVCAFARRRRSVDTTKLSMLDVMTFWRIYQMVGAALSTRTRIRAVSLRTISPVRPPPAVGGCTVGCRCLRVLKLPELALGRVRRTYRLHEAHESRWAYSVWNILR